MRKKVLSVALAGLMCLQLVACGSSGKGGNNSNQNDNAAVTSDTQGSGGDASELSDNGELVNGKFAETKHITVEVYDRSNDGGSDPTNNMYTKYIQDGMLNDYNVEVEFKAVPRWTEVDELNNLLAAGDAPDICMTYDYATIKTYAKMGGVMDLSSLVEDNKSLIPELWNWLGETNMYWDKDPFDGTLWAIEGKRATTNRCNTFIRKDWLTKLNLQVPTTKEEFEKVLIAFRDNAETLLGDEADKMVPYSISYDVGFRTSGLIESFIDPDISDREFYVNGFDDRKLTQEGTKEACVLLNKWYNDGLIWKDFALYKSGDTTEDDMMKAGYVGAITHNWDYPFRNGEDSINANLKRLVGEDAEFVAIDPFEDKNGKHTKYQTSTAGDRKIFFPVTNDEPLASLLYLEWITQPDHIQYLQLGDEGVTHEVLEDGAYSIIAASGDPIMNSVFNIDYTITCNGLKLKDENITKLSIAHSYAGIAPEIVEEADKCAMNDAKQEKNVNVGIIEAEDGMGTTLGEKRDIMFAQVLLAAPDQFDAVWNQYMSDYMASGGQAIKEEREAKWVEVFGDVPDLP